MSDDTGLTPEDLQWLDTLSRRAAPGGCRVCGAPLTQVTVHSADSASEMIYACPEAQPFAFPKGSEDFATEMRHYFESLERPRAASGP